MVVTQPENPSSTTMPAIVAARQPSPSRFRVVAVSVSVSLALRASLPTETDFEIGCKHRVVTETESLRVRLPPRSGHRYDTGYRELLVEDLAEMQVVNGCDPDQKPEQHHHADHVDRLLHLLVDAPPRDQLPAQERQPPTVERRQRQEIEQPQVDADDGDDLQRILPPLRDLPLHHAHDAHRPRELRLLPPGEDLAKSVQDEAAVAHREQEPL